MWILDSGICVLDDWFVNLDEVVAKGWLFSVCMLCGGGQCWDVNSRYGGGEISGG